MVRASMRLLSDKSSDDVKRRDSDTKPGEIANQPFHTRVNSDEETRVRNLGWRLMLIRIASDCETIREFAELSGVGEDTLSKIESAERASITANNALKIKKETGYTTDFLLGNDPAGLTREQKKDLRDARKKLIRDGVNPPDD